MTLPVEGFVNPEPGTQEYNAVLKALLELPKVVKIGEVDDIQYFQVNSTATLGVKHVVRVWEDKDQDFFEDIGLDGESYLRLTQHGRFWIECSCPGNNPPFEADPYGILMWITHMGVAAMVFEKDSGIITWQPKACYHMAAVLNFMSDS